MRKKMTKEVTKTIAKVTKIKQVDGLPVAETLEDVTLLGNVPLDRAQREVQKLHDEAVQVYSVSAETVTYEMDVEDFIKYATVKTEQLEAELQA